MNQSRQSDCPHTSVQQLCVTKPHRVQFRSMYTYCSVSAVTLPTDLITETFSASTRKEFRRLLKSARLRSAAAAAPRCSNCRAAVRVTRRLQLRVDFESTAVRLLTKGH